MSGALELEALFHRKNLSGPSLDMITCSFNQSEAELPHQSSSLLPCHPGQESKPVCWKQLEEATCLPLIVPPSELVRLSNIRYGARPSRALQDSA